MADQNVPIYALSIKQPWAALVVCGLKTIEVRRWPTARRERIFIHAAKVADQRDEAWKHLPSDLEPIAQLQGGVIGAVDVADCRRYADLATFVAEQEAHLNEPSWFTPPILYGFVLANPEIVPFVPVSGWFRFFKVDRSEVAQSDAGKIASLK